MDDSRNLNAKQVRDLFDLKPHPTCGFVAETYRSPDRIPSGALAGPFSDGRPIGSALIFLVTPDAPVRPHRIRNDQLYHHYGGDPLEVLLLLPDGEHVMEILGPDPFAGQRIQLFIPGGTFHAARLARDGRWHLGASTEWPGVEPVDVEAGDISVLGANYPILSAFLEGDTV
jgi:predicted cupin superfamily sugar epimerase